MTTPSFLQGPGGEQSSMRAVLWFFSVLVGAVWAYACIFSPNGPTIVPIPSEVSNLLGYILAAKVGQSSLAESGLVSMLVGKKEQ